MAYNSYDIAMACNNYGLYIVLPEPHPHRRSITYIVMARIAMAHIVMAPHPQLVGDADLRSLSVEAQHPLLCVVQQR